MEGEFTSEERSKMLEELSLFVHGTLGTLHGIGVINHALRREKSQWKKHAFVHAFGAIYSGAAFHFHYKFYKEQAGDE